MRGVEVSLMEASSNCIKGLFIFLSSGFGGNLVLEEYVLRFWVWKVLSLPLAFLREYWSIIGTIKTIDGLG
jgi:hypothetical protein